MINVNALMAFENAMARAKKCRSVEAALGVLEQWCSEHLRDRRKKVTEEKVEKMVAMWEDETPMLTIADAVNLSEVTVRRALKARLGSRFVRWLGRGRPPKD